MRFLFDHHDHCTGSQDIATEAIELRDLDHAERESLYTLCREMSEAAGLHAAVTITVRDETGKPLSTASVHSTVKRF